MNNRIRALALALALAFVLLSACTDKTPKPEALRDVSKLNLGAMSQDERFCLDSENAHYFALSDTGTVYAVTDQHELAEFNRNGELVEAFESAGALRNIRFSDDKIYGYDTEQNKLIVYDPAAKAKTTVSDAFGLDMMDIKDLVIADASAYVLLIPKPEADEHGHNDFGETDDNGFMDYGEKLYEVNLSDGTVKDTGISHVLASYKGTDGTLFLYAYHEGHYILYALDTKKGNPVKIADMDDVGYLYAFVYEAGNLTYVRSGFELYNKRLPDGNAMQIKSDVRAGSGSNTAFYAGHFVYRTIPAYNEDGTVAGPASIYSIYIGHVYEADAEASPGGKAKPAFLTVAESDRPVFNNDAIHGATGLLTMYSGTDFDDTVFLTKLMSGDESADIYIVPSSRIQIQTLKDIGYYEPLGASAPIRDYVEGCFPYLRDYSKVEEEIWGIPLYLDTSVLVYVPKNFESFGLRYEDVSTFDNFIATLEKLQRDGAGDYLYYGGVGFFNYAEKFYEAYHNDYEYGVFDFDTELYRHILSFYDGWNRRLGYDTEGGYHPLFDESSIKHVLYDDENGNTRVYAPEYDSGRMLFSFRSVWDPQEGFNWQTNRENPGTAYDLADWGVYPYPKISEKVTGNLILADYAFVNPYGKHKEEAVTYLEAVASNPHEAILKTCFTQSDAAFYDSVYDLSMQYYQDVYNILRDGKLMRFHSANPYDNYVDDYQQGRMTMDEVIAERQREMEMALGE